MAARLTDAEFDNYRDGPMCCFNIYNTAQKRFCTLCEGHHAMVLRRFECGSLDCYRAAVILEEATEQETKEDEGVVVVQKRGGKKSPCPAVWKVRHCTVHDYYCVEINDKAHLRGSEACTVVGTPKLTEVMKKFLEQEDKAGSAPRNILTKMKANRNITKPRRGWPTPLQIANALKYMRRKNGTKNSMAAIEKLVRDWHYHPGIDAKTAFLFGPLLDDDGHVHVGSGDDDDPLIVGLTSVALLENCAKFMSANQPTIFHADATFKLSDLGYPVITCGFTDQARSYQLAAMFVVSRRTTLDYMRCFNALMARFRDVRARLPRIEFVMGDAEDAQYTAIQGVPELGGATVMMCFFHVLYNIRKKIRHMGVGVRKTVLIGIMEMHFSSDMQDFATVRDRVLRVWRATTGLAAFATYFDQQWLSGRYWRWQAFHTPTGYASTNNPCEIFNASLKSYFRRRRCHMELLLQKLREVIDLTPINPPAPSTFVPVASTDVSSAAKVMLQAGTLRVVATESREVVRVLHLRSRHASRSYSPSAAETNTGSGQQQQQEEEDEDDDDAAFMEAFDAGEDAEHTPSEGVNGDTTENVYENGGGPTFVPRSAWDLGVDAEKVRKSARHLAKHSGWALLRPRGPGRARWLRLGTLPLPQTMSASLHRDGH